MLKRGKTKSAEHNMFNKKREAEIRLKRQHHSKVNDKFSKQEEVIIVL